MEIEDQPWCPHIIRRGITDYLQFALAATKHYTELAPLLAEALRKTGARRILDLCSGGGGPWPYLQLCLAEMGLKVEVRLSDKYPNREAFEKINQQSQGAIGYHATAVDATRVPADGPAFRTMFTAFHHFPPARARAVLADAVSRGQGIGVFEATERHLVALLLTSLAPLHVLVFTPFVRPFRWWRILWTYLIPVIPLVVLFDGLVSCLRTYSVPELRELTAGLGAAQYEWEAGRLKSKWGPIAVTYLIGVPLNGDPAEPEAPTADHKPV